MAYVDGFTHVEGGYNIRWSTVSSSATFRRGNPVMYEAESRTLIEFTSDATAIYGIAQANAADSIGGPLAARMPVAVPNEGSVWATKVQTGVAASALTIGQVFDLEKSANHFRVDVDSIASGRVILIERGTSASAVDSADSSVHVQFLKDFIAPFGSNASLRYQEQ